jgi:hypothetical protein
MQFNGQGYFLSAHGYYARKNGYLHRDIYSATYGNIPHGWHVHHKDENPLNNDIDNLVAMAGREHLLLHNKGHTRRPAGVLATLARINSQTHTATCLRCEEAFTSKGAHPSRFCSRRCRTSYDGKRRRAALRG